MTVTLAKDSSKTNFIEFYWVPNTEKPYETTLCLFGQLFIFGLCYITRNPLMICPNALFFLNNEKEEKTGMKYLCTFCLCDKHGTVAWQVSVVLLSQMSYTDLGDMQFKSKKSECVLNSWVLPNASDYTSLLYLNTSQPAGTITGPWQQLR